MNKITTELNTKEDLGTITVTVKLDGSYTVASTFVKNDTLKTLMNASLAMVKDVLKDEL